jgi:hypothetical protein
MEEKKGAINIPWKELFFKYGKQQLIKLIAKTGLKLTGAWGWVASFFADKVLKYVWPYIVDGAHILKTKFKKEVREEQQKGSVEKVEQVFENPKATPAEKGKAYEEFNNRGR